jgi:hypothetical protein
VYRRAERRALLPDEVRRARGVESLPTMGLELLVSSAYVMNGASGGRPEGSVSLEWFTAAKTRAFSASSVTRLSADGVIC